MTSLFTFTASPAPCGYLPDRDWRLRYEVVGELSAAEYAERLMGGWRRFGHSLFRPACLSCQLCQSLRVDVAAFKPSDSQKRCTKRNRDEVRVEVGEPGLTRDKLNLYDRFHSAQTERKGWPDRGPESAAGYRETYLDNPFPTQEWRYFLGEKLVGVGYVDSLPVGLSAIYFYHDPDERDRGLGTFNVLCLIEEARRRGLPHVYLGFYVPGCGSLEYKARFKPNEVLSGGAWVPFVA